VIEAANATPCGLAAYVFTKEMGRGIRMCERLESGTLGLNEIRIGATEAPFGGVKQSAIGRAGHRLVIRPLADRSSGAVQAHPGCQKIGSDCYNY
jgi:acyl-CoA reductase-like NAD-dependent aldehyde dehydrogenase